MHDGRATGSKGSNPPPPSSRGGPRRRALSFVGALLDERREPPPDGGGLRERKKQRLRDHISNTATRLFLERGFDEVTLGQIAEAAEVSVKTIFNHFGAKEDLFFDRAETMRTSLLATVTDRAPGQTVIAALREQLDAGVMPFLGMPWSVLENPLAITGIRAFREVAAASATLRSRELTITEEWRAQLADALAGELELDPYAADLFASIVLAVISVRGRTLNAALASGDPAGEIEAAVRAAVADSCDRAAVALTGLDRER